MIKNIVTLALICLVTTLFSACADYSVSLNTNEVYTPPTLIANYTISDRELKECIRSAVKENQVTNVKALHSLICPEGNIADLTGLDVFVGLKSLGLAGNKISNLDELSKLRELSQIDLSNNKIVDVYALRSITSLKRVDLRGNKEFNCGSTVNAPKLFLPAHCT